MRKAKLNPAHVLLGRHLDELKLAYGTEARFDETRRWRFDFLLLDYRIAIEIEGSVYAQGRHTRGAGFEQDCWKYATATMLGYRVLRFSTGQVLRGEVKEFLKQWISK